MSNKKTVLVTGGGGYIGGYLCNFVADKGLKVISIDIARQKYLKDSPNIDFHLIDIRDKNKMAPLFKGVDAVFHLAFVQTDSNKVPIETLRAVDIGGTRNVLELSIENKVKKFIHTSSSEIYGAHPNKIINEESDKSLNDPLNLYGLLKTEAELMAWDYSREFNLPMVSLRFPMVCGEGFYNYKILMKMISNLKNNKPVFLVGNGENRFRQVYLGDVLKAYYLSYTNEKALGKAFNICANDSVKLNDMIAYAKKKYKSNSQIIYLPLKPIQKLLKILKFFGIYVIHPGDLEWLCRDILMDNSKAKKILGFKPTKTTKESLEILVDSFLKMDEDILSRDADNPFV